MNEKEFSIKFVYKEFPAEVVEVNSDKFYISVMLKTMPVEYAIAPTYSDFLQIFRNEKVKIKKDGIKFEQLYDLAIYFVNVFKREFINNDDGIMFYPINEISIRVAPHGWSSYMVEYKEEVGG